MAQTVEITVADDGSVTVGLTDAPSAQAQQPAASLAAAFTMAKHLLASGSGSDGGSMAGGVSPDSPGASSDDASGAVAMPSGHSDAPGAPAGGVPGPSSNKGAVTQDPKAIWAQLAAQNNGPVH